MIIALGWHSVSNSDVKYLYITAYVISSKSHYIAHDLKYIHTRNDKAYYIWKRNVAGLFLKYFSCFTEMYGSHSVKSMIVSVASGTIGCR